MNDWIREIAAAHAERIGAGDDARELEQPEPAEPDDDDHILDEADVDEIERDLAADPEGAMAAIRAAWAPDVTIEKARAALDTYRGVLNLARSADPAELVDALPLDIRDVLRGERSNELALGPLELPQGWWQRPPGTPDIPIDLKNTQFEEDRDWTGWVIHAGAGWLRWRLRRRASFRRGAHDYALAGTGPTIRLGLLSDFGTGLYHSRHIAHFLGTLHPDAVFHLGDVYYAGKPDELRDRFAGVLETYLFDQSPRTQMYCLNANHEMMARARPYFAYIDALRAEGRTQQEGSYFRLRVGDRFQVVAIDSSCEADGRPVEGRWRDPGLLAWLDVRLAEGRREGRTNILLSSDYPYHLKGAGTKDLFSDLRRFVDRGDIDLWFWGDSHYCALFPRWRECAFVGSCIGHGGFPYYRVDPGSARRPARFVETRSRFYPYDVRADMGNNGFAVLTLDDASGGVELEYIDWRNQSRRIERLARRGGLFDFG